MKDYEEALALLRAWINAAKISLGYTDWSHMIASTDALLSRAQAPQQEPKPYRVWLIERCTEPVMYFAKEHYGAISWAGAADCALKFPDKEMAQRCIDNTVLAVEADGLRICEHVFDCGITTPQPAIPEGWQLVPKEPTLEMLKAMWHAEPDRTGRVGLLGRTDGWNFACYVAAIAAAPKPEGT